MPNEPVEEQIEQAQPKGPFQMRWLRNLGAKGIIGAGCLLFVFIYSWTHRPVGPRPVAVVPSSPIQKIEEPKKQVPPPAASGNTNTGLASPAEDQRSRDNGGRVAVQPALDPLKELLLLRKQKLAEAAFADNVVKIDSPTVEKQTEKRPADPILQEVSQREKVQRDPDLMLPEGTTIPAVLDSRLEGEFTGPVYAHVSSDVYIPRTRHLVIPQGAWLLGQSDRVGSFGQHRVAVGFHAIKVFDDQKRFCTIDLRKEPGLDQQGATGLTGKVNNHTASLIATAAVVALIQGASLSIGYQGGGYDPRSQVISNMGSGTAQVASRILEPRANRPPTITIPEGTRLNIPITKDLDVTCKGAE